MHRAGREVVTALEADLDIYPPHIARLKDGVRSLSSWTGMNSWGFAEIAPLVFRRLLMRGTAGVSVPHSLST